MVNDSSQILQKKWGPRGYVNGSPTTFQKFVDFMGLKDKGTVCTYVGILICIIVSCTFIELVRCRFEIESSKLQRTIEIVITMQASRLQADDTMIDDEIASLKAFFELPEVSEFYITQGS
eukprot:659617_1